MTVDKIISDLVSIFYCLPLNKQEYELLVMLFHKSTLSLLCLSTKYICEKSSDMIMNAKSSTLNILFVRKIYNTPSLRGNFLDLFVPVFRSDFCSVPLCCTSCTSAKC